MLSDLECLQRGVRQGPADFPDRERDPDDDGPDRDRVHAEDIALCQLLEEVSHVRFSSRVEWMPVSNGTDHDA